MKKLLMSLLFVCAVVIYAAGSFAGPAEMHQGEQCAACGMKVDSGSKYIAQIISPDGKMLPFCDVGDMLHYYKNKMETKPDEVYVRDASSGDWIEAKTALYVKNMKDFSTPMGWGIAAFKDEGEASKHGEAVDFEGSFGMLSDKPMKGMKMPGMQE